MCLFDYPLFISGGIAAAVDFGLLYLLTEFWSLLPWSPSVFPVGLLITYIFSITWIFNQRRISNVDRIAHFQYYRCGWVAGPICLCNTLPRS